MTFETYDPTKHTLEVGTKIRLGGREGRISDIDPRNSETFRHHIDWEFGDKTWECLELWPELQIAVSPLTIDKRVKEEIKKILGSKSIAGGDTLYFNPLGRMVVDYLNSLKET